MGQTIIKTRQIKVTAFDATNHITYSRHFGLRHCSEYLLELPENMWQNLLGCLQGMFIDSLTFYTD